MNDHLTEPGGKVRLYVEAALAERARVEASEGQAHYLLHVMRAKPGDRMSLFNGRDGEWLARVVEVMKRSCAFEVERQTRPQEAAPDLWLCFAPIKKTPADYLAQKATELGSSLLQPVMTQRTIVSRVNTGRMRANAIEAAEQSDRLTVPDIRAALTLEQLLADWPTDRRLLFCDEAGEAPPIAQALGRIAEQAAEGSLGAPDTHATRLRGSISPLEERKWAVLTGPEGGFGPGEREQIRSREFVMPVSLGPRILRADTAALAALSVWQALQGDWR